MSLTSHSSSPVIIFGEGLFENFPYWVFSCVGQRRWTWKIRYIFQCGGSFSW